MRNEQEKAVITAKKTEKGRDYTLVTPKTTVLKYSRECGKRDVLAFKEEVDSHIQAREEDTPVIIDLTGLEFIDSLGFGTILTIRRLADERSKIHEGDEWQPVSFLVTPWLRQALFELLNLHYILAIFDDEEDYRNAYDHAAEPHGIRIMKTGWNYEAGARTIMQVLREGRELYFRKFSGRNEFFEIEESPKKKMRALFDDNEVKPLSELPLDVTRTIDKLFELYDRKGDSYSVWEKAEELYTLLEKQVFLI